ncbi:MAG: PDZ domain-containing protein [Ruminococcaceae bacterium]|nr:PDZ domain-containing protein [Oscillospiraceae bacterium]
MKYEKWNRILSYVLVALLSVTLTVAVMLGIFMSNRQSSKLIALEQLIRERFIGDVDETAIEDAAASAMVNALGDRWSYYIPADEYAAYMEQMNNAYVGVGVTITLEESGDIRVIEVVAGGPAEEAGIQVEDLIVKVEGQSVSGMNLNDIGKQIQGEENTTVSITVLRGSEEKTMEVTRRAIRTPVVEAQLLEESIGLITIFNFNSNCAVETITAIQELMARGAQKLIFDVRNNPGGYAQELVKVLDYLLPEGKLFTTVDYTGVEHTDMSDASCLELPMAVLVNGNSYSAAEFFAAAMAEYDAAVVVGEKTSGKGYFQSTFRLPDGSAVGLSIGKYYTPKGQSLADVGVTPDVQVSLENSQAGLEPMEDPQVLAAIEALNS